MFNRNRLILARERRGQTKKGLAQLADITPVSLTQIETGKQVPKQLTISRLAQALDFPERFFYLDEFDSLSVEAASFRSLARITARQKNAALASGALAFQISDWVSERFDMPTADLKDFDYGSPKIAADALRQDWGLGNQPVKNMINLLESKGIRVFSLAENTQNVDAFSCWRNDTPYIFLNTIKTPERSRFDAAHELGHLVLHQNGMPDQRQAEKEADQFASCFLMPESDIRSRLSDVSDAQTIIQVKKRWRVSAMALSYRLHKLGLITDWSYRSLIIELQELGYRKSEPDGIERETSVAWRKIISHLWKKRITIENIAQDLCVPVSEVEGLVFQIIGAKNIVQRNSKKQLVTNQRSHTEGSNQELKIVN